ncbi:gamma-glutamyl-CDP-amidate hydrolase [Fodinibius salicampi]
MKKIGITQRVVYREEIDERRDVLDQVWYDFAEEVAVQLIPIPNNLSAPVEYITALDVEGIILSGGNNIGISGKELIPDKTIQKDDVALERDQTEMQLIEWATNNQKPVIGVCRGCQFLNAYYGGTQSRVDPAKHVATSHKIDIVEKEWQHTFGPSMSVNSYHNWGISEDNLSGAFIPAATCENYIEGFRDINGNLSGIMWHPERYNKFRSVDIEFFKKMFIR